MKKRLSLVLAAALLLCAVFPVCAAPRVVREPYDASGLPNTFWVSENYDRVPVTKLSANLPAVFDLRNVNGVSFVSEIRDQGITNSCWAFSALSCTESYLMRKAYEENGVAAQYDFSERHMEHATYPDMLDGQNPYAPAFRTPNGGGNAVSVAGYFQNGLGPVSEADMPFKNQMDVQNRADIQFAPEASVRGMRYFPKITNSIFDYNYGELIASIKQEIYSGGGVSAVMNVNAGAYNADGTAYYCQEVTGTANHAITLIGWDDAFSREQFGADKPAGDGAWIARDSAGQDAHADGYFYISYETLDIYNMCFAVTDATYGVFYDNVYSVTSGTWAYGMGYENNNDTAYAANTYQKQSTPELLTDISFNVRGYTEYEIYVNRSGRALSPENLTLAAKGTQDHMGFVTVTLPEPVLLTGTEFSIVIKYVTPGYAYSVPVSVLPFCPEILPDCSFLSPDGLTWEDTALSSCVVGIFGYTTDSAEKSAVSFDKPTSAYVSVYSEGGELIRSKADGSFALAAGTYSYVAQDRTLGTAEGTFAADGVTPQIVEILPSDFTAREDTDLPYVKQKDITFRANMELASYATINLYMGKANNFALCYQDQWGETVAIDSSFYTESGSTVRLSQAFLVPFIETGAEALLLNVVFFDADGKEIKTDDCQIVFTQSAFGGVFSAIANTLYNPTDGVDASYAERLIKLNLAMGSQVQMNQYDVTYPTKTQDGYLICDILVLDAYSGRFYQFQFDGEIPRVLHEVSLQNGTYSVRVRNNVEGLRTVSIYAEYSENGQLLSVSRREVAQVESIFIYSDRGNRVKLFVLSAEDMITPCAPMFDSFTVS